MDYRFARSIIPGRLGEARDRVARQSIQRPTKGRYSISNERWHRGTPSGQRWASDGRLGRFSVVPGGMVIGGTRKGLDCGCHCPCCCKCKCSKCGCTCRCEKPVPWYPAHPVFYRYPNHPVLVYREYYGSDSGYITRPTTTAG